MFARRQAAEVLNVCQVQEVQRQIQGQLPMDLPSLVALRGGEQQAQTGGQCEHHHHEPERASEGSDLDKVIAALKGKGEGKGRQETRELQLWESASLGPRVQVRATAQSRRQRKGQR